VAQARTQLETVRAQLVDVGRRGRSTNMRWDDRRLQIARIQHSVFAVEFDATQYPLGCRRNYSNAAGHCRCRAPHRSRQRADRDHGQRVLSQHQSGRDRRVREHARRHVDSRAERIVDPGAQATELLFDAGQRHAMTDQARRTYEAQVSGYKGVVFLAFEDVEDQLASLRVLEKEQGVEQLAVASAQHSLNISNSDTRAESRATLRC